LLGFGIWMDRSERVDPQTLPMITLGLLSIALAALGTRACLRSRRPIRVSGGNLLLIGLFGLALFAWGFLLLLPAFEFGQMDCLGRHSCRDVDQVSIVTGPVHFWVNVGQGFFVLIGGMFLVFMAAAIAHGQRRE
jgi:hypothetical protein